ncbi:helix-turn-helix domain-containing protein [Denitromonas iodatirespirans]|uniref:Helix-turn-helix domain-containing protein n=1 Tax=Denitromonas iodatirespirans TaxID=2795389 RepID=A0A944HFU0_DENI1|nr:helix-turn-helix domain-containing protein [Denitromonas iodatirespirans]MBT0964016.1 helix-turn-helix domain-containing protein [Denitromonas iodatirespirans]
MKTALPDRVAPPPAVAGPRSRSVPAFALYGETNAAPLELMHIEEIAQRSRLYEWEIEPHVHRGLYQVLWVAAGRARVALDDVLEAVSGPAAIVVPPGTVHGFRFDPGTEGMVLTLNGRFLIEGELQTAGESLRRLFSQARLLCLDGADEAAEARRLEGLLRQLGEEFARPDATDSPVVRWLAQAVVWRLAEHCARRVSDASMDRQARQHQALLTRFLLLAESHFLEHWPVSRYASRLGMSTPSLNRLLRAAGGRPALDYLHERVGREACRRLIYTAAPIGRVAVDLGFEDPAYFCRFFKRRIGLSPGQYRAQHGG